MFWMIISQWVIILSVHPKNIYKKKIQNHNFWHKNFRLKWSNFMKNAQIVSKSAKIFGNVPKLENRRKLRFYSNHLQLVVFSRWMELYLFQRGGKLPTRSSPQESKRLEGDLNKTVSLPFKYHARNFLNFSFTFFYNSVGLAFVSIP